MKPKRWEGWVMGSRGAGVCFVLAVVQGLAAYIAYRRGSYALAMFWAAAFGQNVTGAVSGGLFFKDRA